MVLSSQLINAKGARLLVAAAFTLLLWGCPAPPPPSAIVLTPEGSNCNPICKDHLESKIVKFTGKESAELGGALQGQHGKAKPVVSVGVKDGHFTFSKGVDDPVNGSDVVTLEEGKPIRIVPSSEAQALLKAKSASPSKQ